ncbi:DUF6705 family protein [Chryseobacterium daecheongense]|uniref:DUF6705 domain-containing protein n=1 Tax=Chryseobacterium daecheongense TaxID=192389 RepID=A0A3N0W5I1_9FLAO|nr:DUF6705 family protein [Chryseobacterium daecheongense]ROI00317.1 hypothetical protein EGI05_05375 [Chryseobacterium daecheongense]TDX94722.1 hypothetical protein BCF50_0492 [Chryseobacterium daecheongense]
MKNKIIYLLFILGILSCKAQTISLDQLSQCENGNCPNYTPIKDVNNRLDKFVGIWKGTHTDGRMYEFHFTKKNDFILYGGKPRDMIIGRILIKTNNGTELENTINTTDGQTHFNGFEFDKNLIKYQMYYSGNADCNDKGYVYISFPDSNNLNQMRLVFIQDMDIIASCPNGYQTVMPDAKILLLTKQ